MFRTFRTMMVAGIALTLLSGWLWSKGYESSKTTAGHTVTLTADKYPLIKGNNSLEVKVTDRAGEAAAGAIVGARYFMPPMPGMAPMDYAAELTRHGEAHAFTADIPMEGVWKIEVTIATGSGSTRTATFNLDAR